MREIFQSLTRALVSLKNRFLLGPVYSRYIDSFLLGHVLLSTTGPGYLNCPSGIFFSSEAHLLVVLLWEQPVCISEIQIKLHPTIENVGNLIEMQKDHNF